MLPADQQTSPSSPPSRRMKKSHGPFWERFKLALVVVSLLLGLGTALHAEPREALIIISRNPADPWAVAELEGMLRVLEKANPPVKWTIDYMDWLGAVGAERDPELIAYYEAKFVQKRFPLVLLADEPALAFMIEHHDSLFPQAKVAFCGISMFDEKLREGRPWLTGVLENTDPGASFRLALRLQPGLKRFVILEDSAMSSLGNKLTIEREMPRETQRVAVELHRADSARQLLTYVEGLPPDSAVLLTRSRVARRMSTELLSRCPVPIYGQRAPTHLGSILGGALIDGNWHGEAAAKMGLRLLAGESAANIPTLRDVPLRTVVDYQQMKRFQIPFSRLPPGTEILNRPLRVWEQHPRVAAVTLSALIFLSALVAGLGRALHQKRRNARALKHSNSLLSATLDATADGVLVVDSSKKISNFNQRFLDLWRIPPEVAALRDSEAELAFVIDQLKEPEVFMERVRALYAKPEAESADTLEFKDGRVYYRRSQPQRLDGKIVGRVWTFADVTAERRADEARRKLEGDLAQAHKLEALGTLAGGIAHDFNNLLTAIFGFTQFAYESLPADHSARPDLDAVIKASERARDLVQQILTFSRKRAFERKPIKLAPVINDAIRFLRATVPALIELRCEIEDDSGLVLADGSQIHQAVLNLGSNAAHAIGEQQGSILVRLDRVDVGPVPVKERPQLPEGAYMCITVNDTGPGIDSDTLERVFDPFFTTKDPGQGTGLGLAVVHGVVQSHDGAVTVENTPGSGATFRLFFPVMPAGAVEEAASVPAMAPGHGHILLIDDEMTVLTVGKKMLEALCYQVTACCGPIGALEVVRDRAAAFDLVITDLNMPKMTGLDVAAEIRSIRSDLPIVLVTGFLGDESVEARARTLGVRVFVSKPFNMETLGRAVHAALDKSPSPKDAACAEK
jgi:two-component system, cell cycle sensor histidine kinase and response regulator CckA